MKKAAIWLSLVWLISQAALTTAAEPKNPPNVLFIAVDDLNHWVGHLGRNTQAKTPHIDRLAKMGLSLTNAHCAAPVCNPSRTALLSGRRPSTTGIYDNGHSYDLAVTSAESLVTTFKKAGYYTCGMGKLWHGGLGFSDQWDLAAREGRKEPAPPVDKSIGGIKFGPLDCSDEETVDYQTASFGINQLNKDHDRPFFLTLGFHKPHMPWNVPRKYYDMHPLDQIQLPPYKENDLDDVPAAGKKMAKAQCDHKNVVDSGRWKEAIQAYLAACSYLDAQVGRVLDALEKSAYKDNTIICFWGDHGWHLGEKDHWRKFALWEEATRAPLIWVAPGVTTPNTRSARPVDFMSIYPTLCELTGIPKPAHVEGSSIVKFLKEPQSQAATYALTTFGQNNHAVRTDRWRFIRYANGDEELYDHNDDPYEWTNLASNPEFKAIKEDLATHFPKVNNPAPIAKAKAAGTKKAARKQARAVAKKKMDK